MILTRIPFRIVCIVLLSFLSIHLSAQIFPQITKEDIVKELDKRDLKLEDVEAELLSKGIDINTLEIENITSEDKQTIQRVILEMTAEKHEDARLKK